jgi:Alpha-kinase family
MVLGLCAGFKFNIDGLFFREIIDDLPKQLILGPAADMENHVFFYQYFITTCFLPHNKLKKGFMKFTNCEGLADPRWDKSPDSTLIQCLDTFQHYIIHALKQAFMIHDLQGMDCGGHP